MTEFDVIDTLRQGDRIGPGLVLGVELGRGGAGRVYEAFDERLRRTVAVKVPTSDLGLRALESEGQVLAAFRHTGLPTVYAIGDIDSIPYLVLERLRGHTLYEMMERHRKAGAMPWREALHYLGAVVDIVQVLHRANLAHRDIKPENIMVCPDGRVVVFDMGTLCLEKEFADSTQIQGTPVYLAPEALRGSTNVGAGHLLDVYALGVMGYELLVGELPYHGDSLDELFEATVSAPVPRARNLIVDIPPALDRLISSMMAKEPASRPESTESVQIALRAIAEGRAIRETTREAISVIMVDDDPDYRELMRTCSELFEDRIDLRLAVDGEDALRLLREEPCSLIIIDLEMPKMSGMELVMHLRGLPDASDMLVAIISGKAKPDDRALLSEFGIIDFIEKPSLELEQFVERINALLERAEALPHSL